MKSKKKIVAICILTILIVGVVLTAVFVSLYFCHKPVESYRVVTYMDSNQANRLEQRQLDKCTHIIYGWIDLTEDGPGCRRDLRNGRRLVAK